MGAAPVPATAGVPLHAYPIFPKKKKNQVRVGYGSGTGWLRAKKKAAKTTSFFQKKLKPYRIFSWLWVCRHSLKSSLYRPRSSTGTKLPALPLLAAPSYHSKLLWVLACFICFNFWLYLILIKFLEIWWRHGRKVRKR